jgi:hypothetical protein
MSRDHPIHLSEMLPARQTDPEADAIGDYSVRVEITVIDFFDLCCRKLLQSINAKSKRGMM